MLTARIEKIRQNYVIAKPQISCERAALWTESYKTSEGKPACIRSAQAFYDCCAGLGVHIFEGKLIVGAIGEYRKCGILTPEFSWQWVDREMDHFATRPQDPYSMTDDQRRFVREKIFPYWKGKSLEEAFLARLPAETRHIGVDTGVIDSDSKWRQAVGEVTPDYQDVLFKKGFGGILSENPLSLNPGRFDQYMDPYPISNEQLPAHKTQMYVPQLTIFCQIQRKLCNLRPKSPIHNDFEGTTKIDLRFLSGLL